ncbi:MAG TPA: TRAP transporter small permease subunit [Hyphomicrobiaceae bacterium]|nr:TRAP transporter small permease subunit [Hyphomicrobiaceae bacterium]
MLVRSIDALSRTLGGVAAVLVLVLVALMLYDVLLRYAFNAPTSWGNDMNTYLMGASFLLSIAYAMSTDSHVRVDLLYNEKTRGRLAWVDLIGLTLLTFPTLVWLSWGLWEHFFESLKSGERSGSGGWNPVVWPFKLVMFVGFLFFAIQVGAEIIKRLYAVSGAPLDAAKADEHAM